MSERITRNAARCKKCGDVIESKHLHDWVTCECGAIFVDGGREYWRWGGEPDCFERLGEGAEVTTLGSDTCVERTPDDDKY